MEDVDAGRRRLWVAFHRAYSRAVAAWEARADACLAAGVLLPPEPVTMPFPPELRDLACGARTRAGTRCKRRDLANSGRCKLHGGASTGAATAEGKVRSAANLALRWPRKPKGGQEMTGSEAHGPNTNENNGAA